MIYSHPVKGVCCKIDGGVDELQPFLSFPEVQLFVHEFLVGVLKVITCSSALPLCLVTRQVETIKPVYHQPFNKGIGQVGNMAEQLAEITPSRLLEKYTFLATSYLK